jgi:hypothetical protein
VSLIRVFQRLFRVFVRSLVIFLGMMHCCRAVSVRGEIVELGGSLMRVVWHGVSFRLLNSSRILARIQRNMAAKDSFQAAKLQRSARTTVCSHSRRDRAAMRSIERHSSDTRKELLSGCGQL